MAQLVATLHMVAPVLRLCTRHVPSLEAVASKCLLSEKEQSVIDEVCPGERAFTSVHLNLPSSLDTAQIRSLPSSPPTARTSLESSTAQQLIEGPSFLKSDT